MVLGTLLAGACGGSDDGGATSLPPATTTTSAGGDTTTSAPAASTTAPRVPIPAADPAAVTRAEKGLITQADFGGDWVQFEAGRGGPGDLTPTGAVLRDLNPTSRIGCALSPAGSLAPQAIAAVVDGAILQKGATKRYATSTALAFADEPAARAAIDAYRAPAWSTCRTAAKTRDAQAQPGEAVDPQWKADPIDDNTGRGKGGFEGVVRLQYQAVVDGTLTDANGYETLIFYRVGRTLLIVAVEGLNDPADPPNLVKALNDDLNAATTKALARLA